MFNTIEKLRKESPAKRRRVAFSISLVVTAVIFTVWGSVVFYTYSINPPTFVSNPADKIRAAASSAFAGDFFSSITEQFEGFDEIEAVADKIRAEAQVEAQKEVEESGAVVEGEAEIGQGAPTSVEKATVGEIIIR